MSDNKFKSKNVKITGYIFAFIHGDDFYGMKKDGTAVIISLK